MNSGNISISTQAPRPRGKERENIQRKTLLVARKSSTNRNNSARTPAMTSAVDRKTQGGPGSIHSIQENNPPRRLTRLEKARLESLQAFGNCGFDSMVVKKKDFRTKLKASGATSARKQLKHKNQEEDASVVSHSKVPARKLTRLQKLAEGAENDDKVGHKNGQKTAKKLGMSTTDSRRQSRRVSSRVASGKRLTMVEKARLEAMQSFGEQGLDAVWKSCTQILSKTLEKKGRGGSLMEVEQIETKERRNDKEKSVQEEHETIGVGTSEVLLCDPENNTTSRLSTTVPETGPHHTVASMQCNRKHQDSLQTCTPPKQMTLMQKSSPSSRMALTPQKIEATNADTCEEQDSPSSSDGSLYDKQYPEQRIDLFSTLQGDASFANTEALLETSKSVVRTARNLETPSPQGSPGVI